MVQPKPGTTSATKSLAPVGGCQEAFQTLKEAVLLPRVYPDVLATLKVPPFDGLFLHDPPGTDKTLCKRVLDETEYSTHQGTRRLTVFFRSGADVLSKRVGKGERILREMLQKAQTHTPCITYFNEVECLAPARSSTLEHTHVPLVTVLLGLMDCLAPRGDVVVAGATNGIEVVDPALRRLGRFDCEVR